MGKVIIFAFIVAIIIGGIAAGIVLIGGSAKLTSLIWRGKKNKEERNVQNSQDGSELCRRCGHPVFSRVFHRC